MPDSGEHRPRRRSGTPQRRDPDDSADIDAEDKRSEDCDDGSNRSRFDREFEEWQQPRRIDDVASDTPKDLAGGRPLRADR